MSSDGFTPHVERDEDGRPARLVFTRAADTVAAVSCACRRPSCEKVVPPQPYRRGEPKAYCSDVCRRKHWDEQHPRVAQPEQARLDFTPAASDLAHAVRGRESKASRILARLRQGPATTWELARIGGIRFGARLLELRRAGHRIRTEDRLDHAIYTLEG